MSAVEEEVVVLLLVVAVERPKGDELLVGRATIIGAISCLVRCCCAFETSALCAHGRRPPAPPLPPDPADRAQDTVANDRFYPNLAFMLLEGAVLYG